MIHSVKFTCFLDTNVICPILTRDILLWFAHYELYTPKWSPDIFTEWADVMRRKNVSEAEILKRIENVNLAFAGAMVQDYESIIETLNLPDVKDFPPAYIRRFNIAAKNADDFLTDLIDLNHEIALAAFQMMVSHKKNPDLDEYQVLDICRKNGLKDTADYLHALL